MGTEAARPSDWIPAVPLSWGAMPFRPVTLRHHLSVVLPLSESVRAIGSLCLGQDSDPLRVFPLLSGRQEVDWIDDRDG